MASEKVVLMVVRCCVCGKERIKDQWVEPPEPGAEKEEAERVAVSHSYCPECLESVRRELEELMAS